MKLAWLCYPYPYEEDEGKIVEPKFETTEPYKHHYKRVVPIVYSELEKTE